MDTKHMGKMVHLRILAMGFSAYRIWKELNKAGISTTYQTVLNWGRNKYGPNVDRSIALQTLYIKLCDELATDPFQVEEKLGKGAFGYGNGI